MEASYFGGYFKCPQKYIPPPTAECGRVVANICTIFTCTVLHKASERESGIKARWCFTVSGCFSFVSLFCTLKKGKNTYK